MKRVGIVEYHHHWDYFKDLQAMFNSSEVVVVPFINKRKKSVAKFIEDVEHRTKSLDLLIVNSIQDTMKDIIFWLRFKPKCKAILTIHNINSMLNKPQVNVFKPLRSIDTIASYLCMRFIVLPKFSAIIVLGQSVKDYIEKNGLYEKTIFVLPFKNHEMMYESKNATCVVPGRIEEHRRDYDALLANIKPADKIVLLGEPIGKYGNRIIEKCKEMNKQGYHITFFKRHVPDKTYHNILKDCYVIIFPRVEESHGYGTTKEYYGETKLVGAFFDAVKYGKKFIDGPPWKEVPINYEDYSLEKLRSYCKDEIVNGKW